MNTVLGGQFTSRVNMNLREDKHWSYGAGTLFWDARGPRPFLAYAPVQTDKTKESVAELIEEMRGIGGERAGDGGRAPGRAGQHDPEPARAVGDDGAVLGSIGEIVRFGFEDRYYDGYAAKVRAVSLPDVAAAARVVQPDKLAWVVAGDRAKIEAGLRSSASAR